ncbi:protein kinase [Nannocystis sp. ILAH1]|uniref:serine/threonine-protein kinase n=1 Tax=unclassified Nannocystis TaxID=2627009 RepID=UPI00226FD1F0|nr:MULTISPECIES: serine/threonine protein kinase [unclassified Nannocystis]MCY0986074.1 protein kinase [Nannocystis sp. ILAH1]MCY1068670.1 protein kinase [Nannocystis sp. RBIL2]
MASTDDSPRADVSMTSGPGVLLGGRYRLSSRLGRDTLGELMRGEDLELGRPIAVRFVPPELVVGDELVARLELRRSRNLRLPRGDVPLLADLVDLLDLGHDERGRIFVVTDMFPDASLADELARQGPPPWQRLRSLLVRACQIVHLSHEHGMIRQDLSTSSLYPVRDKNDPGTLKVVSPGLLVASGGRVWSCADPKAALRLARYAAPEQISTGVIDRRTDVYALGVILYECLTGRVPFVDPRPAHVLAAHLITPPAPFPAAVRRRIPAELEAIVLRALAKSPDDRWPTVMALANAMAAIEVGRLQFSGTLDTGDADDFTEHLEPQASALSMRVDRARLSGRAGLVPVSDAASTGEHALRDILDAADSSAVLSRTATSIHDSAPTLPYGRASESATRWAVPPEPGSPRLSPRRLVPLLVAAGLCLVTAGIVSGSLRPAPGRPVSGSFDGAVALSTPRPAAKSPSGSATGRMGPVIPASTLKPASVPEEPCTDPQHGECSGTADHADALAADPPAPSSAAKKAAALHGPSAAQPPLPGLVPARPPGSPAASVPPASPPGDAPGLADGPASPSPGADVPGSPASMAPFLALQPPPSGAGPSQASPSVPPAEDRVPAAGKRSAARPKPAPLPRKPAPGARPSDDGGHELPDPAGPRPATPAP